MLVDEGLADFEFAEVGGGKDGSAVDDEDRVVVGGRRADRPQVDRINGVARALGDARGDVGGRDQGRDRALGD